MPRRLAIAFVVAAVGLVLALLSRPSRADVCAPGNVLRGAEIVRWVDTEGATARLTDAAIVPEGAGWMSQAVIFTSAGASITFDLGAEMPIRGVFLQADAEDSFSLFTSIDGKAWRLISIAEVADAAGLRSRSSTIDGVSARYVRFGEPKGQGSHAATELAIFCERPLDLGADLRVLPRDPDPDPGVAVEGASAETWLALTGSPWLTPTQAALSKLAICLGAIAWLAFGAAVKRGAAREAEDPTSIDDVGVARRAGFAAAALVIAPIAFFFAAVSFSQDGVGVAMLAGVSSMAMLVVAIRAAYRGPLYRRHRGSDPSAKPSKGTLVRTDLQRTRAAVLLALGLAAIAAYFNFGAYHFPDYIHHHEVFHYFTGAKYFRELGYTRLYDCAAVVDAEQGFRRRVELSKIRNLATNGIEPGERALARGEVCKKVFSPERWAAFKKDIAYFRDHTPVDRWQRALRDHGYNPSPVWTMEAAAILGERPASRALIGHGDSMWGGALGLLDPALLALAFAAVGWAFGWQAMGLAVIAFGVSPLSHYLWTGGAYLRQDWLAVTILGVCLLKKGRPLLGGVSLGVATLLRVFPVAFLVALGARAAWVFWKQRKVEKQALHALVGALLAAAVLVPSSSRATGGFGSWTAFVRNTEKQASTASANLVGLRTVMSFRPSTRVEALAQVTKDDVFQVARDARRANFQAMLPVHLALVLAALVALVRVARRVEEPWVLAAMGVAVVPVLTELSCYYFSFSAIAAFAFKDRDDVPIALFTLALVIHVLSLAIGQEDVRYAAVSVAICCFAGFLLVSRGRRAAGAA